MTPWLPLPLRRYYGDRQHSSLSDLLGSLLGCDQDRLAPILDALAKGMPWKGTIPARSSLLDDSQGPSASGELGNSPSTLIARLSRCNTVLCSDTSFDSSAAVQAPKLRWLMETIHNNQNSCPVTMLPGMSSRDFSASQSCIEQGYIKAQSGQFRPPSRRVSSFVNYKSLPIPSMELPKDTVAEPRGSAATSSSAASVQHLVAPTVPAPVITPAPPVIARPGPAAPAPAPAHQPISLEALRLLFPSCAVRPRFDENSVVAALGNTLADAPQLLEAVHRRGSAEHRSTNNSILNLNDMLSLPTIASDGEAEMAFFFGLAQKSEVRVMHVLWKGRDREENHKAPRHALSFTHLLTFRLVPALYRLPKRQAGGPSRCLEAAALLRMPGMRWRSYPWWTQPPASRW